MKCFKSLIIFFLIELSFEQWPKVENVKKSYYLPSLEVKIHAPDQFQPKVQAEISKLEENREKNEKKWMQELEEVYNKELLSAGKEILKVVKDGLAVFDDPNLLKKSVEYAINPPLVVMTSNNMKQINADTSGQNTSVNRPLSPSFKEIAKFKMNNLQKDTMKILIEEDNQVEKMRGAKMSITLDDDDDKYQDNSPKNKINNLINQTPSSNMNIDQNLAQHPSPNSNQNASTKQRQANKNSYKFKQNQNANYHQHSNNILKNGPIDFSKFNFNSLNNFITYSTNSISFVELSSKSMLKNSGGEYSKPISVLMKLPSEPDPKLKSEIGKIEKKREGFETKIFKKAKEEFKLITALTIKELQINLNHELMPFFVVSKNALQGINDVITTIVPAQTASNSPKFLQIDEKELKEKFPHVDTSDPLSFNKKVYSKLLNLFTDGVATNIKENYSKIEKNKNLRKNYKIQSVIKDGPQQIPDLLKNSLKFEYKKCLELIKHLKNLDCRNEQINYNRLNSHLYSSFLQLKGSDSDLINVKFAASDDPYPTIEKLVAQMMTRRDLAEKYERLKILEYESHLQKAENEMVQDILHENLFRIMAFYGPSIEGMKEHIH